MRVEMLKTLKPLKTHLKHSSDEFGKRGEGEYPRIVTSRKLLN